ncbi:MAG TPA: neutral zinc metallopeptidase [Methanomicrobiales archaeon]|jgi:predicted metalloprotease|nr:neutral zinc metallopeptidase [Methanomicrobiales archaeon]
MKWRVEQRSGNIEDRRILGPAGAVIGGIAVVLGLILALVFGINPTSVIEGSGVQERTHLTDEQEAVLADNVSLVLGDMEVVWGGIFRDQLNRTYVDPGLVLFTGSVDSACGFTTSAVGPFYCPDDRKVYLDLDFYYDLQEQYGAPGQFAQAYVIAHEVGHHVQNLLGVLPVVNAEENNATEVEANRLSVATELQADCYAGVWGNQSRRQNLTLDASDVHDALNAASALGDDRLENESQGYVVPDSFTHGTSAQREEWFLKGFDTGEVVACTNPLLPAVT